MTGPIDPKALFNALMTAFLSGTKIPDLGQEIVKGLKGYRSLNKFGVDWNAPKNGLELIMTLYGTTDHRFPFIYVPADMNGIKNRVLSGKDAILGTVIDDQIALALDQATGAPAASFSMSGLSKVCCPSYPKRLTLC